jgi:hypothetical protein
MMVVMMVMVAMRRWDDADIGSCVMMVVVMVVTHTDYNLSDLHIVTHRR